ncbi:MAG: autotransporter-associated beta strand repeat-containing protein [Akkermansia sp.]|nr:autotransporter-associated beta strand repeat-containing protein [Akkermansia sp.]
MKLHLPLSLRSSLLSVLTLIGAALPVQSASMHSDATFVTYNDFGQNKGRYVNDSRANALLLYIRNEVDGGIAITYTDGTTPFTISTEQGMPNFSATIDEGQAGLISPNMVVTVCHQIEAGNIWSYSYGGREIGNYKQQYDVVNIGLNNTFSLHQSSGTSGTYDYMLLRQSRIATDTEGYTLTTIDTSDVSSLSNTHLYHTGSGTKYLFDEETSTSTRLLGVYEYISGAILNINSAEVHSGSTNISLHTESTFLTNGGASVSNPLPAAPKGGDSGSPSFIYNAETGQYEYIAAFQSAAKSDPYSSYAQARGNIDWTRETIASFDAVIDLSQVSEVHLGRVETAGETKSDSGYSTTLYSGNATDSEGNSLGGYIGLHYEKSTWRSLAETLTWTAGDWYHYDQKNFQSASDADLFYTQNLVFRNPSQAETTIVLDATIDTGIGYSEFAKGELDSASFIIKSATSGNYQLHTSGYVIHEDTEVHLRLVNPSNYVSEWRKIGEGDLYIDGEGDTNALLNVGGKGKTYLNQNGGYAAYNVLANSGATVVLSENNGTAQIEKDFTFGAGGGVLDMNGNSMLWYTSAESQTDDSRFSINALTEEAVITNDSKTISTSTLTYKQGGDSTFLGSFVDTEQGALVIDYQGGGTWTLNSIRTDLTHNEASGLTVTNGTVRLSGTNTVHAMGSATGTNISRYTNPNDWHYADAAMKVNVGSGATFELGSHARLTGDVTVQQGGTYVMREGVTHALEYVEGGQQLEDTSRYAAFYGHKGGVNLNGGTFAVLFNEGADSTLSYSGTVSGTGTMIVNTGRDGGVFEFSGVTDSTIQKVVDGGLLRLSGAAAADTENKWLVNTGGVVVENGGVAETLRLINTGSTGVIALVQNRVEQVDLGNHAGMSIGAFNGMAVQYGQAGTSEQLNTWRLGGGGGELVVNYQLSGSHELVLGASSEARGTVTLAGSTETYTGKILVQGITLNAGLLENEIVLNNGCLNVQGELSGKFNASNITGNGTLQLSFSDDIANNELALQEGLQADVHLNKGSVQYNAASCFGGNWTLHDGATLRLGDKVDSVSDTLKLAVSGRGELQGSGDYSFAAGTISGSGEFVNSISGNVTIADLSNLAHYTHASEGTTTIAKASSTVNALSVTAGNVYLETDNDSKRVKGNIVVDGGALHFSSAGTSDMLDYSLPGRSIQVKNGTLDFGTTRQTMGSWSMVLGDGALVTGNGDSTYGAIDFNENNTIQAKEGTSEISAVTRIRNGKTLTYDVAEEASLNVSGKIFTDGTSANIIKRGTGELVLSSTSNNFKGSTTIEAGTLKVEERSILGSGIVNINGACLELVKQYSGVVSVDNISGSGTVALSLTADSSNTLAIDSDFSGTTYVKTGAFALNGSVFGSSVKLGKNVLAQAADSVSMTNLTAADSASLSVAKDKAVTITGTLGGAGTLSVSGGGEVVVKGAVDLARMTIADAMSFTLYNEKAASGAEKQFDLVELGSGAILQTNDREKVTNATTIGCVQLGATSATLQDVYHAGYIAIRSLSLAEGVTGATLTLKKNAQSSYTTLFELGADGVDAGNFSGKIVLDEVAAWSANDEASKSSKRSAAIILSNGDVAKNAVISIADAQSRTAYVGLGVNAPTVTIAGLESVASDGAQAKVFSGTIGTQKEWASGATPGTIGDARRTLNINVAEGGNYTFYGEVMGSLNLVKEGAGTQELAGSSANFNGSIRVENGTLKLGSSALGMLEKASSVVVNGGRLDLSAAGSSANLTYVSGEGAVVLQYNKDGNGTAFDFSSFGGVVELAKGRIQLNTSTFGEECPDFLLTSSDSQLVFNGKGTVVNSNVHVAADSTDFHVNYDCSGTIGGDITGKSLVKHGDGSLTVGGNMKLDSMLSTYKGQVILTGAENSIANVDGAMSNGNTAVGTLRLAQDARLEVTGNIWSRSNTGIYLDSGAVLDISGKSLSIANRAEEGTASLAATTATGPGAYAINSTDYQISNAHVTYTGGDATVRNKLTNAAIENAGSGVLKVWNAANSLAGVQATKGEIRLFDQAEHQLNHLEVAEGLKVSAYTGVNEKAEMYAALHVSGLAEFGSGATLNADMVLQSGAVLDMGGTVMLDGVLTLQAGLTLDGAVLDAVQGLAVGESHILFTGVDGLKVQSLQQAVTLYNMRSLAEQTNDALSYSALMDGGQVAAADYFSNLLGNSGLVLSYNGTAGTVTITNTQAVPEPTTATLSLLALAGLCARRRRR